MSASALPPHPWVGGGSLIELRDTVIIVKDVLTYLLVMEAQAVEPPGERMDSGRVAIFTALLRALDHVEAGLTAEMARSAKNERVDA